MIDEVIFQRTDSSEVQQRLVKIHEYCITHPGTRPSDLRLELAETTYMIRRYKSAVKAGEFNAN